MSKLRELEKRLGEEPTNLGLRVMVAGALREVGRHEDAVELYRSVAMVYRDQGRGQQAIAVCRSILEIAPEDPRCHALLASLVADHGRARRDTAETVDDELVIEVDTPPPARARAASAPGRPATVPPPVLAPMQTATTLPKPVLGRATVPFPKPAPVRRSSFDETPLPAPMPHHIADPTARLRKLSQVDLPVAEGAKTRAGEEVPHVEGIALAARRISASLAGLPAAGDDLAAALDTRKHRRLESHELATIAQPPPTAPLSRFERREVVDDDAPTPSPADTLELRARGRDRDEVTALDDDEEDDSIPTLSDEDHEEKTNPRELPIETMLRTEQEGPLAGAFFAPLPVDRRGSVFMRFHAKHVAAGTTVIRQGEVGHSLVVVVRGQLELRIERARRQVVHLGAVTVGEFIGEASLLSRTPAPVQVVATTECELLVLPPRDFYEIAGAFPALWAELKDVAERRTRELDARLKR
ncbi:MAG: cyclic nucleotide-binding domain-containing protein [Myxococcota bacterium]|nr:cyclic nucleotide-binding domain-containing protein [Myxococcota bacterium]